MRQCGGSGQSADRAADNCAEVRRIVCRLEGGRLKRISADRLQIGRGDNCEEVRRIVCRLEGRRLKRISEDSLQIEEVEDWSEFRWIGCRLEGETIVQKFGG